MKIKCVIYNVFYIISFIEPFYEIIYKLSLIDVVIISKIWKNLVNLHGFTSNAYKFR